MCFPVGPVGEDISLLIYTVQSRLVAAVKHDSIDTASKLLRITFMETCKEAAWTKARDSKIKCKPQNKWFDQECKKEKKLMTN